MISRKRVSVAATCILLSALTAAAQDPRIGLGGGFQNAQSAIRNLELVGHGDKPENMYNPQNLGDFGFLNSDLAFQGNTLFQGSFNGMQFWDISDVSKPTLKLAFPCPGGQGDPSIYGHLLFMSVEEPRGRVDCGAGGVPDSVSKDRFRGVRIFDVTDMAHPKQVAAVQTCRGSHTHTLAVDPKDKANIYVYVSGTSFVRSPNELASCSGRKPEEDPNTSLFRIDIIKVPLAHPEQAKVIASPRIFQTGTNINGLYQGGGHGDTTIRNVTNQCHDITIYMAMGIAAGACSGNGIILDVRNPSKPVRISEVSDPNFAYWHSATFSNDAKKVLYTDEWGGGTQPRCRTTDRRDWGADAIFTRDGRKLTPASYYKLPVAQTPEENCVAHNGSLVPVPGRDIMAQGWYQGGVSVVDFTDAAHPKEIAFFDRGPLDTTKMLIGGSWGAYWYNGHIFSSEIGRGIDILDLKPSEFMTQNEIDAAKSITWTELNPQAQTKLVWPATFSLARAYLDQLGRNDGLKADRREAIAAALAAAESNTGGARRSALAKLAASVEKDVKGAGDSARVQLLAGAVRDLSKK